MNEGSLSASTASLVVEPACWLLDCEPYESRCRNKRPSASAIARASGLSGRQVLVARAKAYLVVRRPPIHRLVDPLERGLVMLSSGRSLALSSIVCDAKQALSRWSW